jgi:hypothetical protein
MDKGRLHHFWRRLQPISPWYFLALCLIFGVVGVYGLRQNNLKMIQLRSAVYATDQQNGDVETSLRTLREFVYAHMNTDLASGNNSIKPPIQLKFRYERLVAAQKQNASDVNSKIYTDAQAYCELHFPAGLSGSNRIPCIQDYIVSHGGTTEKAIPDALYKFDFVSPKWSPDLAGWSLLASGLFGILFIIRFLTERWLRSQLRE